MHFQSFNFLLIFLPIVLGAYYLVKNNDLRNIILIISSFIFYAWGNVLWALILMSSAIVDFTIAQKIYALSLQNESNQDYLVVQKINCQRKILLILSIIFNIGLLSFFKYWDWIVGGVQSYFAIDLEFLKHNLSLPVAISFYTFESLSYTFDIYRGKFQPTRKFIDYLTFVAFFPKLIAGPIMRAHELLPQLTKLRAKVSSRNFELALFLIFWGLFKKLVFADNLGHLVNRCRENISTPGAGLILGTAFAFQLYCDFSAYCDIARGCAKLFSIKLQRNFLTPYFLRNASEFFQRWNITLSSWVRDYVYKVIKGDKSGVIISLVSFYISMFLFGLWHGASIFFIFYGLYTATVIIVCRVTKIDKILIKVFGHNLGTVLSMMLCFSFIMYGAIIFWVKDYQVFLIASHSFFQTFAVVFSAQKFSPIFFQLGYGLMLFAIPIFITDLSGYRRNREFVDLYPIFSLPLKVVLYIVMFYLTLFFASRGSYDFIYFQF